MQEKEFAQIFHELERVEKELQQVGNNQEKRQQCYEKLLAMRRRMDRYVECWLHYEEKINKMQEKFIYFLPYEMPVNFLPASFTSITRYLTQPL